MASCPVHPVSLWTLGFGGLVWMVFSALAGSGALLCPPPHSLCAPRHLHEGLACGSQRLQPSLVLQGLEGGGV